MRLMKTPRSLDLALTNRCNLKCKYCSHFTSASDIGNDVPKEEWLKFIKELGSCAVMKVILTGGEPFCREDLKDIIEGIVHNRMRYSIFSNGTLITNEMAAFLASTGRCDIVQVSIDGSSPTFHDALRGKGSFFRAMEGIQYLQKHNVTVSVSFTITRQNFMELEDATRFLLEEVGLPGFFINSAHYLGLCRQNTEDVQLTIEEYSLAMEITKKIGI